MTWKQEDPQGNESGKISWEIVKWTRGRGLDVGAGLYRTFPHFITVDNNIDTVLFGQQMPRPDLFVKDAAELDMVATESMDFVFSSHMLEHVKEEHVVKTLREWMRVIRFEGYLVLYLPDEDEYPKVGEEGANHDHKWNVNYERVIKFMEHCGNWDLLDFQKRNQEREYSLYFVFQKKLKKQAFSWQKPKPTKTAGVVRYGAFGDLMQASSVCAALKADGFHVTLYTSYPGVGVIETDPHIDEFYIQDKDQVPNQALGPFWDYHAKKYDRWVNLSESVEGTLLTIRNRINDTYMPTVRHELCNKNYLEYQHFLAGVDHHAPQVKFFPTEDEVAWVRQERTKMQPFVIAWALNGSSRHKVWPWLDEVMSGLLVDFPEVDIVLVGDESSTVLEQGWEKTQRVHCRSNKWSMRKTLAFVQVADVVIGPETGVMNAVAQEPMPKVVFLSHSTVENLTRDWVNTHSLASVGTVCKGRGNDQVPACHQMHYDWTTCTEAPCKPGTEEMYSRKGSGVAQCQYDISAQEAYKVIWHVVQWQLEAYAKRDGLPPPGVIQLTEEQVRKVRGTLPAHMQGPLEVIKDIESPPQKSVIEV